MGKKKEKELMSSENTKKLMKQRIRELEDRVDNLEEDRSVLVNTLGDLQDRFEKVEQRQRPEEMNKKMETEEEAKARRAAEAE